MSRRKVKNGEKNFSRRSLLFFLPYFSARLDFPSPPLSWHVPGSQRIPFERTWRKHTSTHVHSHYTSSKTPHSFPNSSPGKTQTKTWSLSSLQKRSCQRAAENSQGRPWWGSDAPCQSRKHLSKKLSFKYTFDGSLEANCQANSVPPSLVSLVNILYGPNIEMQASTLTKSQAGLSNCQLLQCNSYRRRCSRDVKRERRNKSCLRCTALCTRTEDCDYTWLLIKLYMVTFFFPKKTKYSYGAAFPVKNE